MLSVKDEGRLLRITEYCQRIISKIEKIDKDKFNSDQDLKEIVSFNIFQIGELAKGFSLEFIKKYDGVPWKHIKGMRDIIGHGYGAVDFEMVYNTAKEDIPILLDYCCAIIEEISQSKV